MTTRTVDPPGQRSAAGNLSRRVFAQALGVTAVGASVTGCAEAISAETPPEPGAAVARLSELRAGAVKDFRFPTEGDSAFLVKLGRPAEGGVGPDRDIVGFLRGCPHMGCRLNEVDVDAAVLGPCACHRSKFDLARAGRQMIGRAVQRAVQVDLVVDENGNIYASGVRGLPYGRALGSEP